MEEKTIAAISTPAGTGGIGIIRISGTQAVQIAEKMFRPYKGSLSELEGYSGLLGRVFDKNGDIDEAIAFVYHAPKSYTGENVVELSCHGGLWIVQRVLRLCCENGAVPAEPGEFTKRAFLNGKLDLIQAEAVMNLINAQSAAANREALAARDGRLSTEIGKIVETLVSQSAHLSAWADYPDEDIEEVTASALLQEIKTALEKAQKLLNTGDSGKIIHEGIRTAIVGAPNVGKSTLMNMLAGYKRSIVTEIPGTTRDIVEDTVRMGDIVLRLYDTAGIRDTEDVVESIGIDMAKHALETAQLVLAVFDSSAELEAQEIEAVSCVDKPVIAVVNKVDLPQKLDLEKIKADYSEVVLISAESGEGHELLEDAVLRAAKVKDIDLSAPIVSSERQRNFLSVAVDSLTGAVSALEMGVPLDAVNVEIDYALDALLAMQGEKASDKVLDEVFSRFCVGK